MMGKLGAASEVDKMKETRLRWFRHVSRRCIDAPMTRCERLVVIGLWRGRLRKNLEEVIRHDINISNKGRGLG